ncbi:MAG: haloacid dehalogenase-like hydrolase [Gemmatimonadetes bacterium]|nr:haloacid dehalogenase-like hydrolase [Gemmatimonadota bacterium]
MKLILFDIDGTLLWTSGAGRRAMEAALVTHFGHAGAPGYRYDGKTDIQIVRESMREAGVEDATISARMNDVLAMYLERLGVEIEAPHTTMHRYDGVMELLDALEARADRVTGLLTGNIVEGANRKLRAVGVAPERFRLGAFGSDHEHRHELPAIAVRRAHETLGLAFEGSRVVIIGDTPADIHCGRGIGARAIGVATGHYTVEDLAAHDPAAVLPSLGDTAAVLRAIDNA